MTLALRRKRGVGGENKTTEDRENIIAEKELRINLPKTKMVKSP